MGLFVRYLRYLGFFSVLIGLGILTACGDENPTFSILPDKNFFYADDNTLAAKADILWVIDNSGSMRTSQDNIAANFTAFIEEFDSRDFDFRIAVTSTEAYLSRYNGYSATEFTKYRDGVYDSHSGIFVLDQNTPDLISAFTQNVLIGTGGTGDERALQSFHDALVHEVNAEFGFPRSDALLSIIIVSDEDDRSTDGQGYVDRRDDPRLHSTASYKTFLDNLKGSGRAYSVSAVAIWNDNCKDQLDDNWPGRKVGHRYAELIDATIPIDPDLPADDPERLRLEEERENNKVSLCSNDFGADLVKVAKAVVSKVTEYYLNQLPNPDSIIVRVNGSVVPRNPTNGWQYIASSNSIKFYGSAIPAQGSVIEVDFDPISIR